MTKDSDSTAEQIAIQLQLQDKFSKAFPTQDLLEDIPVEVLPQDYRSHISLRSDRDSFYIAFSDNADDLKPTEEGFMPNAHIRQISVMNGPRRVGGAIKEWIDKTREAENPNK